MACLPSGSDRLKVQPDPEGELLMHTIALPD